MPLTIKAIDAAKPSEKPYKLTDGDALYLEVRPTGAKYWRANLNINGKQKTQTYGRYPNVGLAEARKLNAERKVEQPKVIAKAKVRTFSEIFEEWIVIKLPTLKNMKYKIQVENTIRKSVLPAIGDLPIDKINRKELVTLIKKFAHVPETGKRIGQRINQVFDYALDAGDIEAHNAANLGRVLPKSKSSSMATLPPSETGKLLHDIMTYNEPITRLGLLMVAHTFVRVNEIQNMRWDEIIIKDKVWVIPAKRMKMGLAHVVPLSTQVIKLLEELSLYTDGTGLVLESPIREGHSISENTLLFALYRLGYRGRMTVHGFRSLASTVLNEHFVGQGDVIERQLAHGEDDAVRGAYNNAQYLPQRREFMQWYSDWLDQQYISQSQLQAIC